MKALNFILYLITACIFLSCGYFDKTSDKKNDLELEKIELEKEKLKLERDKLNKESSDKSDQNVKEPVTPVSSSNSYTGDVDGSNVKGSMTFNKDKSVTGSFYYVSNPSAVYKIQGTNYKDGEIDVNIYFKGQEYRSGTMTKTLTNSFIIWEGDLWGDQERMYLTLKRPR